MDVLANGWDTLSGWLMPALNAVSLVTAVACLALYLRQRRRGAVLTRSLEHATTQLRDEPAARARGEFDLALDEAVQRFDDAGQRFCVLYVDIDNLGSVNDVYGHQGGDGVLRDAHARLRQDLGDTLRAVSRIAADEFALVVPGDEAAGLAAAVRVEGLFARPFAIGGRELRLTCSIGVAGYPQHGSRPRLLGNAVLAMRSVKHTGGGGHAVYDPEMGRAHREQAALLHDLRNAVERGQFELYYQPKIDAHSLQITAAEALLRWRHPERGLVSPTVFIPIAERYGLINTLGDWVIAEACRQAAAWRKLGLRMRVAVNISGVQLRQDGFVDRIEAALKRHRIPAGRFTCEITESVAMEDTQATQQAFEQLRRAGVHVSIDDFGTGHSSLASLRRLPAAELKIDRAFVTDLDSSNEARTIARAIVQMARTLDLRVVAEGVETEAQRDFLVGIGVDELQGYLFAKPMSATAIALWACDDRPGNSAGDFRASLFQETQPAVLDPRR